MIPACADSEPISLMPSASPMTQTGNTAADQALAFADHYYQSGQLEAARDFLQIAALAQPDQPSVLATLGALHYHLHNLNAAETHLTDAVRLDPSQPSWQTQLAAVYLAQNRSWDFEQTIRHALNLAPDHLEALRLLESHLRTTQRWPEAARTNYGILQQQPSDIPTILALAKCFYKIGDMDMAVASLEEALRLDPANPIAREGLQILDQASKRPDDVALSAKPDDALDDALAKADNAFACGDLVTARTHLRQARSLRPHNGEICAALGALEYQLRNYDEACTLLQQAAHAQPDRADTHVQLAAAALELNRFELFETALARTFEIQPDHREGLRLLANTNLKAGRFPDAARGFYQILQQDRDDVPALLGLGHCLIQVGDYPTAKAAYEEILKRDPHHRAAQEALGQIAEAS